jgi:hypothetical protein
MLAGSADVQPCSKLRLRRNSNACRYRLQPEVVLQRELMGEQADQLAAELPGLVSVQVNGASRKAVVGNARQHEKLLEKVGCASSFLKTQTPLTLIDRLQVLCTWPAHLSEGNTKGHLTGNCIIQAWSSPWHLCITA